MTRRIMIAAAAVLTIIMLCSCGNRTSAAVEPEQEYSGSSIFEEMPEYYIFQSGAGAWRTVMKIENDGTIEGRYLCGAAGGPEICDFTGRFTDITKLDDYSYSMRLAELEYDAPGNIVRTYEDGTEMYSTEPYGLYSYDDGRVSESFILYLPGAPEKCFDEDFRSWAVRNEVSCTPVLDSYVIYNSEEGCPFFESDEQIYNAIVTD